MSDIIAFRLAVAAALVMLGIGAVMGVTAPPCHELPMSTLTAFELARTGEDLQRIFGMAGDACRAPVVLQLDRANLIDATAYIPAYAAFYGFALYAIARKDKAIGWVAVVGLVVACAIADWIENAAMFQLSASPETPGNWLTILVIATNVKWVGLAIATTLGGVMLWRRGGLGWLAFLACATPLPASLWAVAGPDAAGKYLVPGMAVASVMLLAVAVRSSFASKKPAPAA